MEETELEKHQDELEKIYMEWAKSKQRAEFLQREVNELLDERQNLRRQVAELSLKIEELGKKEK